MQNISYQGLLSFNDGLSDLRYPKHIDVMLRMLPVTSQELVMVMASTFGLYQDMMQFDELLAGEVLRTIPHLRYRYFILTHSMKSEHIAFVKHYEKTLPLMTWHIPERSRYISDIQWVTTRPTDQVPTDSGNGDSSTINSTPVPSSEAIVQSVEDSVCDEVVSTASVNDDRTHSAVSVIVNESESTLCAVESIATDSLQVVEHQISVTPVSTNVENVHIPVHEVFDANILDIDRACVACHSDGTLSVEHSNQSCLSKSLSSTTFRAADSGQPTVEFQDGTTTFIKQRKSYSKNGFIRKTVYTASTFCESYEYITNTSGNQTPYNESLQIGCDRVVSCRADIYTVSLLHLQSGIDLELGSNYIKYKPPDKSKVMTSVHRDFGRH